MLSIQKQIKIFDLLQYIKILKKNKFQKIASIWMQIATNAIAFWLQPRG